MIRYINLGACFSNEGIVPARLWTNRHKQLPGDSTPPCFLPSGQPDDDIWQALRSVSSLLFFPEGVGRWQEAKEKGKKEHGRRKGNRMWSQKLGVGSGGGSCGLQGALTFHFSPESPIMSTMPPHWKGQDTSLDLQNQRTQPCFSLPCLPPDTHFNYDPLVYSMAKAVIKERHLYSVH